MPFHDNHVMRPGLCTVWLLLFTAAVGKQGQAAEPSPRWRTGRELLVQRSIPVTASWSQSPLRAALADLSRSQRVAIVLDRRVDPDQPLSLTMDAPALEDAVERIARRCQLEASWFGSLIYLGPPPAARRLRTLAALRSEEAARFSAERKRTFQDEQPWHWDDLTTPRDLCQALAAEANVELESLERLPHDLWAAADLPPLSWIERLTLVANEFDLTFEFQSKGEILRLVPIAEPVRIERSYPGGGRPAELVKRYARLAPDADVERVGGKVIVRGRIEDHERLTAKPKPRSRDKPGIDVYTMRAHDQPLAAVLDKLRNQLGLKLNVDQNELEKAGIRLDQRITFGVEEVSLEELLTAILKPAGLTFRGEGTEFEIRPSAECGVRNDAGP